MSNWIVPKAFAKEVESFYLKPSAYNALPTFMPNRRTPTWILVGHTPIEVDLEEWASWFEASTNERTINKTTVGDALVSTVFLGVDHGFGKFGELPMLFETMVFGGANDQWTQWTQRWRSWDEAGEGHQRTVLALRLGIAL